MSSNLKQLRLIASLAFMILYIPMAHAKKVQETAPKTSIDSLETRVQRLENKYSELDKKVNNLFQEDSIRVSREMGSIDKTKQGEEKATTSRTAYYLIILGLMCLGGYWLYRRMRSNLEEERTEHPKRKRSKNKAITSEIPANTEDIQEDTSKTEVIEAPKTETVETVDKKNTEEEDAVKASVLIRQDETSRSEAREASSEPLTALSSEATLTETKPTPSIDRGWIVLHGSQIGASHIASKLPCQDSSAYKDLGKGWGICVVSDGAGSASHSHYGSKAVCHIALREVESFIYHGKYIDERQLPAENVWQQAAVHVFRTIKKELNTLAATYGVALKELSATCMIAVHSPYGVFSTHIGDGRGGYQPKDSQQWLSLFTPHKGEEANQTLFVTSPWESLKALGGVSVPESAIYIGETKALCLLSDGMEKATFECTMWNETLQRYEDLNRPSAKIFSQLVSVVRENIASGETYDRLQQRWMSYLESGTSSIKNEPDDKTMLLAVQFN